MNEAASANWSEKAGAVRSPSGHTRISGCRTYRIWFARIDTRAFGTSTSVSTGFS